MLSLPGILFSLSSVPMFASRPFLAAFLTSALARFGPDVPLAFVRESAIVRALAGAPEWFRSDAALGILLVLAIAEAFAAHEPEVRALLDDVQGWLKAIVAGLVSLAVIDTDTAAAVDAIHRSDVGLGLVWSAGIGTLVFFAALLRRAVMAWVAEIDDDDDLGLQSLIGWAENAWTVGWMLVLIVLPLAALVLSALTALGLVLARRWAERAEQRSRVPCAHCRAPIFPHATVCHACRTEVALPMAVGVFGQARARPAADRGRQRFDLVSRKRCPDCATRLRQRAVSQRCTTCGRTTFAGRAEFDAYLGALAERLPRTLRVCFLFGLVPVLGVVPGVIYYRLSLVAGLRGYIPPLRGCATRWFVRLVQWGLVGLQGIPIAGAVILPLMCWSTYAIYRRSLRDRAAGELAASVAVEPA